MNERRASGGCIACRSRGRGGGLPGRGGGARVCLRWGAAGGHVSPPPGRGAPRPPPRRASAPHRRARLCCTRHPRARQSQRARRTRRTRRRYLTDVHAKPRRASRLVTRAPPTPAPPRAAVHRCARECNARCTHTPAPRIDFHRLFRRTRYAVRSFRWPYFAVFCACVRPYVFISRACARKQVIHVTRTKIKYIRVRYARPIHVAPLAFKLRAFYINSHCNFPLHISPCRRDATTVWQT